MLCSEAPLTLRQRSSAPGAGSDKATNPQSKPLAKALLICLRNPLPMDVFHECIDVCCRLRAVVDVIRMLVHIKREDRCRTDENMRVVSRPLIHEPVASVRPDKKYPSRAASQGFPYCGKFDAPALQRAEVLREPVVEVPARQVAVAAQPVEIAFVKNHGISRDEFLALQAVHHEHRRRAIVELG